MSKQYLTERQQRINRVLAHYLPESTSYLYQAMHYAVLNGGKRLRPLLVYATGETLGASLDQLDNAACAVELTHAYSLIHDDLPAMDNDDFRRGQPTCHKVYGEAIAILAGDALQALAFEILSKNNANLVNVLAKASGAEGMAGGQALEFSPGQFPLETIQRLKTGMLIRASIQLGASIAKADHFQLQQLDKYADCLGLAYQIQDDIQDKQNYADETEIITAKNKIRELHQQAVAALEIFSDQAVPLQELTRYMLLS